MQGRLRWGAMMLGICWAGAAMSAQPSTVVADVESARTGGPYVPTPGPVIEEMLRLARVGPHDHLIDLGSGDGVIVITAAYQMKSSGYGVDIDAELVRKANARARDLGLSGRIHFEVKDVFKADLSKATVVTLYLLPDMMRALLPKLYGELRAGTRIVSHDYHFDAWDHHETVTIDAPDKELILGIPQATLYLWVVPAKVAGVWRVVVDGVSEQKLTLRQTYNTVEGEVAQGEENIRLATTRVRGTDITFVANSGNGWWHFRGRVDGDRMEGDVDIPGGRTVRWRAARQSS